ncbi:MAG: Tim44/TimA family putative adaptor protein [Pseudomonadota bacterium]
MDGAFPYGDIIVIGAIAAFILLRYRAMLGESRGRDETSIRPNAAPATDYERVIQLPAARVMAVADSKEEFAGKYGSLAETFVAMRAIDRDFAPDDFLQGARAAYEMVIAAFSKSDRETLKMLLSKEMYASFDLSLSEAQAAKRINDTTLVAITKAEIAQAKLTGSLATITVDFVTDQIHLIRDENGAIIEGNASQEHQVEDRWVFTRTLTSGNPNWTIIET